jgi:hypothetical protein
MMSPQTCDVLAQRLSVAERQLAVDRTEIAALRRDLSAHRRSRWMANAFATIGVVAAVMLVRSPDPQAQKSQAAAPLVVKAPFTVVDRANMPILRVQESGDNGARGAFVFNSGNYAVATLQIREGGSGSLTLSDVDGEIVVEAGVNVNGKGIVKAGPASAPTGPGIPPSFILGAKK